MQRNLNIREATFKDLELLAKYDDQVNQTPWTKHRYHSSFTNRDKIFILEFNSSKEIIATIVFNVVGNDSDILQIWVRQEYLRQGYSEILFKYTIEQLINLEVSQIFLEVVEYNQAAINLYTKLGFKYLHLRKNYYRIGGNSVNAIVMKLELTNL